MNKEERTRKDLELFRKRLLGELTDIKVLIGAVAALLFLILLILAKLALGSS